VSQLPEVLGKVVNLFSEDEELPFNLCSLFFFVFLTIICLQDTLPHFSNSYISILSIDSTKMIQLKIFSTSTFSNLVFLQKLFPYFEIGGSESPFKGHYYELILLVC